MWRNVYSLESVWLCDSAQRWIIARGASPEKHWSVMRILLNIIGVLLVIAGSVWFLQGVNVLPGSFMTGQTKWAVYGGLAFVAGVLLLVSANRRRV